MAVQATRLLNCHSISSDLANWINPIISEKQSQTAEEVAIRLDFTCGFDIKGDFVPSGKIFMFRKDVGGEFSTRDQIPGVVFHKQLGYIKEYCLSAATHQGIGGQRTYHIMAEAKVSNGNGAILGHKTFKYSGDNFA